MKVPNCPETCVGTSERADASFPNKWIGLIGMKFLDRESEKALPFLASRKRRNKTKAAGASGNLALLDVLWGNQ